LVVAAVCLAIVAVGANIFWWATPPNLEPMPALNTEELDPEIRDLLNSAVANVVHEGRSAAAWGDLGAVYYAHAFEAQSQVCFRNAERLDPADYRWPYLLAWSLSASDPEQIAAYRRAARRSNQQLHVQLRLAENLLDRGEFEDAAAQIDSVLNYAPDVPRALFAKARLLFALGNLKEARAYAQRSTEQAADKRAPYMRAPYTLLAQLCRRTNDASGEGLALAALKQIPQGSPAWEDPDIATVRSLNRSRSHRLIVADDLARSGNSALGTTMLYQMTMEHDASTAAEKLALALNREGNFAEAETVLRRQLHAAPNDERLHYLLGVTSYEQKKYAESEAAFRRVVELKPDYAFAWHNRGLALIMLGKPENAREAFAAAVRFNPTEVTSRLNLAELLVAEGKHDEARECLKLALKLEPESARARELLKRVEGP
jgi:tetratricopeptide (TPR) repeat protein